MLRLFPLALLFLAACSFAPLKFTVNLLDELPDQISGSFMLDASDATLDLLPLLGQTQGEFTQNLPVGGVTLPLSFTLQVQRGKLSTSRMSRCPVTLQAATLRYTLELESENLSGALEVQPYLAPAGTSSVAQPIYALGAVQRVTLGGSSALQANVTLNEAQLAGINNRSLRLALGVSGDAGVAAAGEVVLGYEFSELTLDVGAVGAVTNTRLPDNDGETLDFRDAEVPGPGRLIGATLDYDLTLTHNADATGALTAQIYVAPPGTDLLWQEKFLFDQVSVDMSQQEVNLVGQATLNDAQRPLLSEQQLRIGVRISGDAVLTTGETTTVFYNMNKLDLRVSYAL